MFHVKHHNGGSDEQSRTYRRTRSASHPHRADVPSTHVTQARTRSAPRMRSQVLTRIQQGTFRQNSPRSVQQISERVDGVFADLTRVSPLSACIVTSPHLAALRPRNPAFLRFRVLALLQPCIPHLSICPSVHLSVQLYRHLPTYSRPRVAREASFGDCNSELREASTATFHMKHCSWRSTVAKGRHSAQSAVSIQYSREPEPSSVA